MEPGGFSPHAMHGIPSFINNNAKQNNAKWCQKDKKKEERTLLKTYLVWK